MAFPTDWGRKCAITIDYTKVGASLTDFPVLITKDMLPSEMFDADGAYPALNGGGDIRFSSDSAGATQLACQIVSFVTDNNPANGSAEIWVKVPSVSSSANTVIYVWYNKSGESQPARTDTYGSDNVWNSNYKGVYHMNETSGNALDSTSLQNDLTDNNTVGTATGKIGKGRDFISANTEYFNRDNDTDHGFSNNFSVQAIVNFDALNSYEWIVEKSVDGSPTASMNYRLFKDNANKIAWGDDGSTDILSASAVSNSTFYIVHGIKSSSTGLRLYVNGSLSNNNASRTTSRTPDSSADLQVGRRNYTGSNLPMNGVIDEVRLVGAVLSDGWISTEYNNWNSPSTFATAGTPSGPGTVSPAKPALLFSLIS